MISSFLALVRRTVIILFALFAPVAAFAQEQGAPEPNAAQEEPTARQGTLTVPNTSEAASPKQEIAATNAAEPDGTYIIRDGDTLWDISNSFLKDPFLWPFIWKVNPAIADPDLIYPGNRLVIPNLAPIERAIQAPAVQEEQLVEKQEPTPPAQNTTEATTLIIPEEGPVPIIDKYTMLNAGFVASEESKDLVVGSPEGKTIMSYDDLVYVSIGSKANPSIGDRFLIYRPHNKVKHPVTGKKYGRLIRVLGVLQLVEAGKPGTFKARVTLSFDAIEIGSMLTPYQEPTLIYDAAAKLKDIAGYVLEVVDTRTINGQIDILYLDKGTVDGVEPGDRFHVYTKAEKKDYPRILIGEAQVFLVKERTSTAMVRKSIDAITKGHMIEFKK